jgi:hypothetical protein
VLSAASAAPIHRALRNPDIDVSPVRHLEVAKLTVE